MSGFSQPVEPLPQLSSDAYVWSDGTPVTAADYVVRYLMESDPDVGSNMRISWEGVALEALGTHELRFSFDELSRSSMVMLNRAPLPDHVLGELYRSGGASAVRDAWGADSAASELLTTGPWKLTASGGGMYMFERNQYFGVWNQDSAGNRLPHVDRVVLRPDGGSSLGELFVAGTIDWAAVDDATLAQVQAGTTGFETVHHASANPSSLFFTFNHNLASDPFLEELFRNPRFRVAMSHLVDRQWIIDNVYAGGAAPQWTSVYLSMPTWVDDTVVKYPFDPAEAARILGDELGFTVNGDGWLEDAGGRELAFAMTTNEGNPMLNQVWRSRVKGEMPTDAMRASGTQRILQLTWIDTAN